MSSLGVSTTVEQDHRHSRLIVRVLTTRRLAGVTLQARRTELRADADGLTVEGDLGGYKPGILYLPWSRVRELHYAPARAGETGGLYAREGSLCSRCIAPRLSEGQTADILAALLRQLPNLARSVEFDIDPDAPATLSASPATLTSLDLSPRRPTLHAPSFSHALSATPQSMIGRKHESARRLY